MSLKDQTYKILKNRIITCQYPPGTLINERETIEEMGISRTPFREAVNALSHEGWLEPIPHKGILVSGITLKDVLDLYSIREQLEPFAVSLAVGNVPNDVLNRYYDSLKEAANTNNNGYDDEAVQKDEDLHKMILTYANNRWLFHMMDEIYEHNHRIRVLSMERSPGVITITAKQHFEIINAMRDCNADASIQSMKEHIISSKHRALYAILNQNNHFSIDFISPSNNS